jgi:hypothetical protein
MLGSAGGLEERAPPVDISPINLSHHRKLLVSPARAA